MYLQKGNIAGDSVCTFQGDNGKFTFAMRTDPRKAFSINSTTGVIAVKDSTVLDYEDHRARVFTLLVCFLSFS